MAKTKTTEPKTQTAEDRRVPRPATMAQRIERDLNQYAESEAGSLRRRWWAKLRELLARIEDPRDGDAEALLELADKLKLTRAQLGEMASALAYVARMDALEAEALPEAEARKLVEQADRELLRVLKENEEREAAARNKVAATLNHSFQREYRRQEKHKMHRKFPHLFGVEWADYDE